MTTTTATRPALTLEAFLCLPDTEPASEYAHGSAEQKPMPTSAHGILQGYLFVLLYQFLRQHRLGVVATEWRCVFGVDGRRSGAQPRALIPDITYVSFDRYPHGDLRDTPYVRTAPDLVVEILSPGQDALRFADKLQFYLVHGVRLVWVVDPDEERVCVFTAGAVADWLEAGDTLDGSDVLPGFTAAVADIFAELHV